MKKYMFKTSFFLVFLSFFFSHTRLCFVAIYPGYFLLQTLALLLLGHRALRGGERPAPLPSLLVYPLLFLIWGMASLSWAHAPWAVWEGGVRLATFTALTFGLYHLFSISPELRRKTWDLCLWGLALVALGYGANLIYHDFDVPGRFGFPFANPNLAGSVLGFGAMLALTRLFYLLGRERQKAVLPGVCFVLLAWLTGACGSKSGLLSMLFAILTLVYFLWPPSQKILRTFFFGAMAGTAWWMHSGGKEFLLRSAIGPSLEVRLSVWADTLKMIFHSPLRFFLGWGSGNFFPNFPNFQDPRFYSSIYSSDLVHFPHNFFLELLAEYGAIGLLLFLSMICRTLWALWRLWKKNEAFEERTDLAAVFGGTFLLMFDALSSVSLSYPHVQFFLALIVAWTASSREASEKRIFVPVRFPRFFSRAFLVLSVLFLSVSWKYYGLDSLFFHLDFKKARIRPSDRVALMLSVEPPRYDNLYTMQWRINLGDVLIDHYEKNPFLVEKNLAPFYVLGEKMPAFGTYWLSRAVLFSKQGKSKEAEDHFLLAARKNPFSELLWIHWGVSCKNRVTDPVKMREMALFYQETYPDHGGPVMGESIARHLLGEKERAQSLAQKAQRWAQSRLERHYEKRAEAIGQWAREYLISFKSVPGKK